MEGLDLGEVENAVRDELLRRLVHYDRELSRLDKKLEAMACAFPQVEVLMQLHGIGLYSALLIVAEIGEPWRFRDGRADGPPWGLARHAIEGIPSAVKMIGRRTSKRYHARTRVQEKPGR